MKLRKKTRGETDCLIKMRELLKSSSDGLELSFNVMKRERKKQLLDDHMRLQLDRTIESVHLPQVLRKLSQTEILQTDFLAAANEIKNITEPASLSHFRLKALEAACKMMS
jgi:hypothetical protein